MPEYIEQEALLQDISETVLFSARGGAELPTSEMRGANKVIDRIKSAKTADVVEVRHGEWHEFDNYICNSDDKPVAKIGSVFICSECGREEYKKEPYCHCGAKMDGKGEGE